ncbi:MAG TPA: BACON domain-containing carbohydrate-binding protein [Longimicrobiales bacterium]|nr:BACON domain-containing carbohydrate-binding protein [Longimicrobiales bacterium]
MSGALTACGDGPVSPTDCSTLTLTPSSITVPSAGGEGSIAVSARSGCSWQVQTAAAWVQWLSGTSGTGDGTVRYWIGTNVVTAARDATVTAAAAAARITQEAASQGCSYQVTPATTVVPARATGFAIRVFAPFGCRWTFLGNGGWLRVIPDSDGAPNGNGNGTVVGDILENGAEAARTGTAVVAGQLVTVLQDGTRIGACAFTVTPASLDFGAGGGPGRVAVATTDYCHWNALIGGPDYGVVAPSDGTSRAGNGAVDFVVSPNPSAAARQGSLVIRSATGVGEAVLTVNQAGR